MNPCVLCCASDASSKIGQLQTVVLLRSLTVKTSSGCSVCLVQRAHERMCVQQMQVQGGLFLKMACCAGVSDA